MYYKLIQDALFSKLHYRKTSEFGVIMLSLLNRNRSFEKMITYMSLLKIDYAADFDFSNAHLINEIDLLDDIRKRANKNIIKNLHLIIFYELSFKMIALAYYINSKSVLIPSSVTTQNVILANLFMDVALMNDCVSDFDASILSYITLLI